MERTKARSPEIPVHIYQIVAELEHWIEAATRPDLSDDQAFRYSQNEESVLEQLATLGWNAVLNDKTGKWLPSPVDYTIIHNVPDPLYYPQRCYKVPEGPARWEHIWDGGTKTSFPSWQEAYNFIFAYDEERQKVLPLKCYEVLSMFACVGARYAARTADQAAQLHLNFCVESNRLTRAEVLAHRVTVYEHRIGHALYCEACRHNPCQVPIGAMPAESGQVA